MMNHSKPFPWPLTSREIKTVLKRVKPPQYKIDQCYGELKFYDDTRAKASQITQEFGFFQYDEIGHYFKK